MLLKNQSRPRRKGPPPGDTGQEVLYLRFLSEKQVPVTVKLRDGEAVYGWIEYFDDRMIRLTREGKPNLFIYKDQIRTISESFRNIEARRRERNRSGKEKTNALPPAASTGSPSASGGEKAQPLLSDGHPVDRLHLIDGILTQGGS
jgi:host factor-I protein